MKSLLTQFVLSRKYSGASAWLALTAAGLFCAASSGRAAVPTLTPALTAYDAAVKAGATAPLAKLMTPVTLDGTGGAPFDFGATFGDTTIEFILQGDSTKTGDSGYLAVGETSSSSLRYEQWQNTARLGFTQAGVADYQFTPGVPSPTTPTHLAYAWSATDLSLKLYVNGVLTGTTTGVSDTFVMPSGPGFLGATAAGAEAMVGTIYRVTVYSGLLSDAEIKNHADAFADVALPIVSSFTATPSQIQPQTSVVLNWQVKNAMSVFLNNAPVTGTSQTVSPAVTTIYTLLVSNEVSTATAKVKVLVDPRLDQYDAAIAADKASGLVPVATLTNTVNLTGAGGEPFDFGANSGDVTIEFVMEGDSDATGDSGYLAVGENTSSNLRYEQWQNTHQMGFTQLGVADYLFVPGVPSPAIATHVAYVWNAATFSMKIYVNGVLSGTINKVSDTFAMPTGAGFLGANPTGGEAVVGRIFRVAVYDEIVPEVTVKRHANAFTSVLRPPIIGSFTATPAELVGQGSVTLSWQAQNATAVYLNGVDVSSVTNQTVSPAVTTAYTLLASNSVSTVSAKLTVQVTPLLDTYDAAIAADQKSGLTPVVTLTQPVTLTGAGGVPFNFGATSGDATMEFILEGDPTAGADGYLAVGENTSSNLRYAQWSNTRQMGFTQLGVADYLFTPALSSPTVPTHVAYAWNAAELSMTVYTNGALAGTVTGVSDTFAMPTGAGFLGATPAGGEAMVGRIFRIVVYQGVVPEASIQKHAAAFVSVSRGPSLTLDLKSAQPAVTLQGVAGTHYRVEFRNSLSASDSWQLLQDVPSLSGTALRVVDSAPAAGRSQRFYRALSVR